MFINKYMYTCTQLLEILKSPVEEIRKKWGWLNKASLRVKTLFYDVIMTL